jgi:ubiquinone/menaquinone biosynthesis C-methylase UbiE
VEFTTRYRGRFVIRAIRPFIAPESRVLDIGCGNGVITHAIAQSLGCRIAGTDVLEYPRRAISFKKMTQGDKLDFGDGEFDTALFIESLHHMPREAQSVLIKEALRVAQQVLIFEVEPGRFLRPVDFLLNQVHNHEMSMTYSFKSKDEWIRLFDDNRIPATPVNVAKPFLGLWFTYHLFRLTKGVRG